ncbi:MAG: ribonuclease HI [Patescibacteria group bacterium]|nr:ribonuclease HI [Patescibacteria group bacterium]
MQKTIEIYTDGSSLGNPGPGGWGIVVINDSDSLEIGGSEKNTTNNRMELVAVIESLKYVIKKHPKENVVIYADSSYVLGGITTWIHNWEKNGWRTANKKPVLNQDLWQELIALVREFKGTLSWQKVKGHAGHIHNERADQIATEYSSLQKNHIF